MAAGQGFKTFTTGEVLTAGDVNGYLMQGINVFTNATARDAAITAPAEGQFAFTKDTNSLWYYDGAAWVASGAAGDIEGVTAGVGISGGGTSGTVTVTNSMATAIDAKGDLVPGTGADTFARLPVGANATVLTADSTEATGLKWAAASGGALTIAQIASGSLSGAGLTLSGLTSYDSIYVRLYNAYPANPTGLKVTINNNTGANYWHVGAEMDLTAFTNASSQSATSLYSNQNVKNVANNNSWEFDFTNAKNAGFTKYAYDAQYFSNGSTNVFETRRGCFINAAAVSTIEIKFDGQNFSGGSYVVWGG